MAIATLVCINPFCSDSIHGPNPIVERNRHVYIDEPIVPGLRGNFVKCYCCTQYSCVVIDLDPTYNGRIEENEHVMTFFSRDNHLLPQPIRFPFLPGTMPVLSPATIEECRQHMLFRQRNMARNQTPVIRALMGNRPRGIPLRLATAPHRLIPTVPVPMTPPTIPTIPTIPTTPTTPTTAAAQSSTTLPPLRGVQMRPLTDAERAMECGVCFDTDPLDPADPNDKMVTICNHVFHRTELARWQNARSNATTFPTAFGDLPTQYTQNYNQCPQCRTELFPR